MDFGVDPITRTRSCFLTLTVFSVEAQPATRSAPSLNMDLKRPTRAVIAPYWLTSPSWPVKETEYGRETYLLSCAAVMGDRGYTQSNQISLMCHRSTLRVDDSHGQHVRALAARHPRVSLETPHMHCSGHSITGVTTAANRPSTSLIWIKACLSSNVA